ncbi:MAG: polysaccharide deacetylase family protein [Acidobacteria bacterium]|nr:polysaccharide deacetylase family protein [Acidobacteriota bacterium]
MFLLVAAIGIGTVVLAHVAPFPFLIEALRPERSLWHVPQNTAAPTVYLTYDDGPNPEATPMLLDVLQRARARATFFLIDAHVTEETAPIVRRAVEEGHAVALHSNERWLLVHTPDDLADTLRRAATRIGRAAGAPPCALFRPHAGWRSAAMYAALERLNFRLAGWSWGLWDWNWWRARDGASLADRLSRRASDGDIIVMHDGHHLDPRADRRYAVEATSRLIPALRSRGFELGVLPCG